MNHLYFKIILILFFIYSFSLQDEIVIDSEMTFEQAIEGINIPQSVLKNLTLVDIQYYSFDNKLHQGQLLIHKSVVKDITEIFEIIKNIKFPVQKAIPIVKYGWNDIVSMKANNTSAFNYRKVRNTRINSYHSKGLAIDINPMLNPHIKRHDISPSGAVYDKNIIGTLTDTSQVVREFKRRGWIWGGNWRTSKDYQHFEKRTN